VDVARIDRLVVRHGERFTRRCFTDAEVAFCTGRARPAEHFAARFAAKEAAVKALGTGVAGGVLLRDVEVTGEPSGRPLLCFAGAAAERAAALGARRAHVSLTHTGSHAAAVVVLEGGPEA